MEHYLNKTYPESVDSCCVLRTVPVRAEHLPDAITSRAFRSTGRGVENAWPKHMDTKQTPHIFLLISILRYKPRSNQSSPPTAQPSPHTQSQLQRGPSCGKETLATAFPGAFITRSVFPCQRGQKPAHSARRHDNSESRLPESRPASAQPANHR